MDPSSGMGVVEALIHSLWWRWLSFGWIGRTASIAAVLCGSGWLFAQIGASGIASELWLAGIFVASVLAAALFIRLIWRDATAHHRR